MNSLIYTTFRPKDEEYQELIWEWLASLRTLGAYSGEVLIFDYGMPQYLVDALRERNVRVEKLPIRECHQISNYRNLDTIDILEEYKDYQIAHYDADIWFQSPIFRMFQNIPQNGMYFAVERGRTCRFRGAPECLEKHEDNQRTLEGFVFGGWMAGNAYQYLLFLRTMRDEFLSSRWSLEEWGSDQSLLNYLACPSDRFDGLEFAASHYFLQDTNNALLLDGLLVTAVHLTAFGNWQKVQHLRFKNRFSRLYNEFTS